METNSTPPADIAAAYFEAWKAYDVDGRIDCIRVTFDPRPLLEP